MTGQADSAQQSIDGLVNGLTFLAGHIDEQLKGEGFDVLRAATGPINPPEAEWVKLEAVFSRGEQQLSYLLQIIQIHSAAPFPIRSMVTLEVMLGRHPNSPETIYYHTQQADQQINEQLLQRLTRGENTDLLDALRQQEAVYMIKTKVPKSIGAIAARLWKAFEGPNHLNHSAYSFYDRIGTNRNLKAPVLHVRDAFLKTYFGVRLLDPVDPVSAYNPTRRLRDVRGSSFEVMIPPKNEAAATFHSRRLREAVAETQRFYGSQHVSR